MRVSASPPLSDPHAVVARRWRGPVVGLATGAALLGGSWAAFEASPGRVPSWEVRAFNAIHRLPERWTGTVWPVMQLGNFWAIGAGAGAAYAVWRRPAPAVAVGGAGLGAWALAKAVKRAAARGRPAALVEEVDVRERGIHGDGYVSGHAAVAFALATAFAPRLPSAARPVAFGLAATVGGTRLYVGAHLPLDVIGGAGVGVLCGSAANLVLGPRVT